MSSGEQQTAGMPDALHAGIACLAAPCIENDGDEVDDALHAELPTASGSEATRREARPGSAALRNLLKTG